MNPSRPGRSGLRVRAVASVALWLIGLAASAPAQPSERPTIGVALGGGSARGLAHVGVLRWLHEHRIPVDVLAGTSMGGLVGGAYATGFDPDELRDLLLTVDWDLMFLGEPPYRQREFRRKEDRRQFTVGIEAGLRGGFSLPSGLDPAHQVGLFLSYLAFPYPDTTDFDDLPTPFRAIATNMDDAEVTVLAEGSLGHALLATMAIPGVFPSVTIDGVRLADGGMLNNVPADVVRDLGADVVIAVDVGEDDATQDVDALGQASRAIGVMMDANTRRALQSADLIIAPNLEGFSSLDWRRSEGLAMRGYEAAAAMAEQLLPHAVGEDEWLAWHQARRDRRRERSYVTRSLAVRGTTPELEALILERLEPHLDDALDFDQLNDDLTWVTGSDHFDSVRYEATDDQGLLIVAREKSNGPPFMRFGLDLNNEALDLAVGFRARLIALDVGKPGAEVRADLAVGRTVGAGIEYYWPFAGTRMFFAPRALAFRETRNIFRDDEFVSSVRDRTAAVGGDLGFTTSHSLEIRLGYQIGDVESSVAIGDPQPEVSGAEELARARLVFDRMDAPIVPERGYRIRGEADYYFEAPGATKEFGRAAASASVFEPLSDVDRLFGGVRGGSSFAGDAPLLYQFDLGGPFRLSSFDRDRFRGQRFLYGNAGYLREIYRLPDFLGGAVYATGFFETATAYDDYDDAEWHLSGSGGIIMDTILGPLLVAGAFGDESSAKFYFILGDLFR